MFRYYRENLHVNHLGTMVIFNFFSGIQLQTFFGLQLNQCSLHQSYTSDSDIHILKIKTAAIAKSEYLASTVILNKLPVSCFERCDMICSSLQLFHLPMI